jgi:hypothetical protein
MSDEFDDAPDPALPRCMPLPDAPPAARLPGLISEAYGQAAQPLRAKLLECLLRPLSPLALAVVAAGAFGGLLQRGAPVAVSSEDAARFSATQILELARFVEQCSPQVFQQAAALLADPRMGMAALAGSALVSPLLRSLCGTPAAAPAVPMVSAVPAGSAAALGQDA